MFDTNQSQTPARTINDLGNKIFHDLFSCYSVLYPDKSLKNFSEEVWLGMIRESGVSGEKIHKVLLKTPGNIAPVAPILISIAYCAEAREHHNAERFDHAWSAMAEANYWCGVSMAGKGIPDARAQTIIAARKQTAAKGGESRREKYKPIIEEAYRLAREMSPPKNGWKSRSQAGKAIRPAVEKFAGERDIKLTENQALKTIDGWLREMPDANKLFPTKLGAG